MSTRVNLQAVRRGLVACLISACAILGASPVMASTVVAENAVPRPIPQVDSSVRPSGWDLDLTLRLGGTSTQSVLGGPIPRHASDPVPRLAVPLLQLWRNTARIVLYSLTSRSAIPGPIPRIWFKK